MTHIRIRGDTMYRRELDLKLIGENLKRCRKAKNLTVEQVRKYMRLGTPQAVYKWEAGKSCPPGDSLLSLMELYHAEVSDIIGTPKTKEDTKTIHPDSQKERMYFRLSMYYMLFTRRQCN